jgi:hypothetical protein
MSGSALKVLLGGAVQLITLSLPTEVEVELGWDNKEHMHIPQASKVTLKVQH